MESDGNESAREGQGEDMPSSFLQYMVDARSNSAAAFVPEPRPNVLPMSAVALVMGPPAKKKRVTKAKTLGDTSVGARWTDAATRNLIDIYEAE